MKRILLGVTALTAVALIPAALADDSSAQLGAGGIVLTKNADIRMASEDLYISPKRVKVHYTFVNDTDGNSFALWQYTESTGGGEIAPAELSLIGVFNANGNVTTSEIMLM